ncbi:MAG: TIGR00730 family Rossman fold protein, partial [Sulfurimonas sp.]|nr:TIGR00730 family Rossman fold protein [Sulfurimonas sp.]
DKLLNEGMIDQEDLELICLTDEFEQVVDDIEVSLSSQLKVLEDAGLKSTSYYKSLSSLRK